MERVWDYTMLSTFLECRKKYYYRMVRHLTPKVTSAPLEFGGAIHKALEMWYNSNSMDKAIAIFRETYKDREGDSLRTQENGEKLLRWYAKVYAKEPFTLAAKPEIGFVYPIGDILYAGRIDLPVRWGKELWIVEHKTASVLNFNYFKQFDLDFQITGYILCAEAYFGEKCFGCVVNALQPWKETKRVTEKTKKAEEHFYRDPKTRTTQLRERFKLNVQRYVRDILWCEKENEFYECERKDQCYSYNSECPFKTLCMYGEDHRVIEREYKVEKWEPFKEVEEVKK